ncbi:C1 family peptidase [Nostoc sp. DedSLP04]|uniref:C1 family peptidase n=1 Tax=Nostoc sp. DedSLP04 TaxID=3075401 RepID=UPI002AD2DB1C|nr:C1 family peptidase [Nostoc sp. DedSLP04]MDZ8031443.1 C1 family peptidase [Nostoc sp. DedSLP04]
MPNFRMGWLPDRPDFRDYCLEKIIEDSKNKERIRLQQTTLVNDFTLQIKNRTVVQKNGREDKKQTSLLLPFKEATDQSSASLQYPINIHLPSHVDLRQWCSPIEEQGNLKSCTAIAGVALVEYFERKVMGEDINASSLFLYKVARNLMHLTGDTGASTRFAMKAMALFGIPPEEYWPYEIENFDEEPPAFCYAYAQHYQAIQYFRLDLPILTKEQALGNIKHFLAAGVPAMFGFTTYSSILNNKTVKTGKIPYPNYGEKMVGGHAVVAVGYDDNKSIDHPNYKSINNSNNKSLTLGAFLIRNCWGEDWGEDGYGWLPYEYVLKGLATDWWSLLKNEWVDEGQFGISQNSHILGSDLDHKVPTTTRIPPEDKPKTKIEKSNKNITITTVKK